jgi:hypothetical protein
MSSTPFPAEELRRKLLEAGVPRERHALPQLLELLPASLERRPYDEMTPDMVAEVVVYLVAHGVLSVPPAAEREPGWGEQVCRSYRTHDDLLDLVVPYFAQGLSRNERCLWVAPAALASRIGRQEDQRLRDLRELGDRLELVVDGIPDWQREERRSLAEGYAGLRVCGELMHAAIGHLRVKALCTHPL